MKHHRSILFWTAAAVIYGLILHLNDAYAFQFMEQRHTFFADGEYLRYTLRQLGGPALLLSDIIRQLFCVPYLGTVITAILLSMGAFMTHRILRRFSTMDGLELLSMIPFAAYAAQMSDMDFQYFGLIAQLFVTAALLGYMQLREGWRRPACAVLLTVILFAICGAAAMLFAVSAVILELFRDPRRAGLCLAAPLTALAAGMAACHAGLAGSLRHVLTPHAYFTLRLQVGDRVWLSWAAWGAVLLLAALSGLFRYRRTWSRVLSCVFSAALLAGSTAFFLTAFVSRADVRFKELSVSASKGDWDHIISACPESRMNNLLYQNYLNIALAEKGILADHLLKEPVQSIRSIFVETNKTPYVSVLLSDVFYSMGQMGLAQRYAFEGCEGWGSYSPRMYRRLVITNMAYGAYPVAQKYISLLKRNPMHRGWATAHEKMLADEAALMADPEISSARKCIFPEDKLSGLNGLDEDLMRVIESNPEHKSTVQYLGCLYLLLKDGDSFMSMMNECIGKGYISMPLPVMFQEAVLSFAGTDPETVSRYGIDGEVLSRHEAFLSDSKSSRHSYWFYLKYR